MVEKEFFYSNRKEFMTVRDLLKDSFTKHAEKALFKFEKNGTRSEKKYKEVFGDILSLQAAFSKWNLSKKHFAILGKSSYEWMTSYLSVLYAGYVVIPIDRALPREEIVKQIKFVDAECLLFDADYEDVASKVRESVSTVKYFVNFNTKEDNSYYIYDILEKSSDDIKSKVLPNTMTQIVFSSGTTGKSKAVALSQQNLSSNVAYSSQVVNVSEKDTLLSILPNNHTYELTVGILTPIYFGATICLNGSLRMLKENLKFYKPTIMIVVPGVLEMFYKKILKQVKAANRQKNFSEDMNMSNLQWQTNTVMRQNLCSNIINMFGGNIKTFVCGGAFLPLYLYDFYKAIDINLVVGYGITECSPLVAANTDRDSERGSVGKVGKSCMVKIMNDEIWVKGKNVMQGYYKDYKSTEACIKDGWFNTGDIGYINSKGYLYITGRKKNLILLSNGENVNAEEIENKLLELDCIIEAIVFSKNNMIEAEIYPNYDLFKCESNEKIKNILEKKVNEINSKLPVFKQIQKIEIRNNEFEKTTTGKIKRGEEDRNNG